jgi:hypothetical protein
MTADFSFFILLLVVKQWLNTLNMLLLWLLYMFLLWILTGFLTRFSRHTAGCLLCLHPRIKVCGNYGADRCLLWLGENNEKSLVQKTGKEGLSA